jgi:molybdopterin/thiamine biosynthesis adenylyltransferase
MTETAQLQRLPRFVGLATDAAAVLAALRVLVVGVGSVGARAVMELARCGIRRLGLVDAKHFAPNFQTQAIRSRDDVGRSKAATTAGWARAIAPATEITAYHRPFETLPLALLDDYDIVLASTDNLAAEMAVGRHCASMATPLVYASLHGETLTAQLRIFANRDGTGPCPACGFGRSEWAMLSRQTQQSCAPDLDNPAALPTTSIGALCALTANLAVIQVVRMALRLGDPPADALMEYNGYGHATATSALRRNRDCPGEHRPFERATVAGPWARRTLRDCAAASGLAGFAEDISYTVDGREYVGRAQCRDCDSIVPLERFVARDTPLPCPSCALGWMESLPFYTLQGLCPSASGLEGHLDMPLGELGAGESAVIVRGGDRATLVTANNISEGASS